LDDGNIFQRWQAAVQINLPANFWSSGSDSTISCFLISDNVPVIVSNQSSLFKLKANATQTTLKPQMLLESSTQG